MKLRRKLIIVGGYSYAITLPTEWLKHNGLSKGDSVEISVTSDNIVEVTKCKV